MLRLRLDERLLGYCYMEGAITPKLNIRQEMPIDSVFDSRPNLVAMPTADRLDVLAALEILRPLEAKHSPPIVERLSEAWFRQIEQKRYSRHGSWLPGVLECRRHAGERVLVVSDGIGTDAGRFAEAGADVTVFAASEEHAEIIRRNFRVRNRHAVVHVRRGAKLPARDAAWDVVYLELPHTGIIPEFSALAEEVYRVLKPGGKLLALLPSAYDTAYWQDRLFPWQRWFRTMPRNSLPKASGAQLRRDFADFVELSIAKRHLRRSDLPHLWRWLPLVLLERIMGRFLLFTALKPLITALPIPVAA